MLYDVKTYQLIYLKCQDHNVIIVNVLGGTVIDMVTNRNCCGDGVCKTIGLKVDMTLYRSRFGK
jgi:hypothetical protein